MAARIVVGVPGPWPTREDVIAAMDEAHGRDILFAGVICIERASNSQAAVELRTHDPRLLDTFTIAGRGRIGQATLDRVAAHRFTAVISHSDCSPDGCHLAARIARAFLKAGGVGVRVESAGTAHEAKAWTTLLAAATKPYHLYDLFVSLVEGDENYQTCGMQNYGLPDAVMAKSVDGTKAAGILGTFNRYQIVDRPKLRDGERFAVAHNAPRFRLARRPATAYAPDSPMHNPFGMWRLEPVG